MMTFQCKMHLRRPHARGMTVVSGPDEVNHRTACPAMIQCTGIEVRRPFQADTCAQRGIVPCEVFIVCLTPFLCLMSASRRMTNWRSGQAESLTYRSPMSLEAFDVAF